MNESIPLLQSKNKVDLKKNFRQRKRKTAFQTFRSATKMSNKWKGYSSLLFSTSSSTTTTTSDKKQGHNITDDNDDDHYDENHDGNIETTSVSRRRRRRQHQQQLHSDNDEDDDYVLPNRPVSSTDDDDPLASRPARNYNNSVTTSQQQQQRHNTNQQYLYYVDIEDAIDRIGMGYFQYQIIIACGLCFAADAMEVLLLSFLAIILQSEWQLSESQTDSIISIVFVGAMIGTVVLSRLGDIWGRRPVFALTAAIISIFGIATAFCTTYIQIVIARFLVGFGVGGLTVPYDALSEFMPTSYRGTNLLSTSFFWTGGSLLVPFFAWLTLGEGDNGGSWRAFVTLCALPCIISTVLGIFLVPESPRWLLTRGKNEKALRILRRAAAKNGRDPLLTFPEGIQLIDHAVAKSTRQSTIRNNDEDDHADYTTTSIVNQEEKKNNFKVLCSNPRWRTMAVLLGGLWYGLAFTYYGAIIAVSIVFSDSTTQSQDYEADNDDRPNYGFDYSAIFISSSAEMIGLTIAILTVDRLGRVTTQTWSYFLGGLCILILGLLDFYVGGDVQQHNTQEADETTEQQQEPLEEEQEEERRHLIFFAFLARMFIMAATSITWLHTSELLPTEIRATGHGLANAMGRIGGITSPFIITESTSLRTIGIVMFLISALTSYFSHSLPETAGKALGDFEGDDNGELSSKIHQSQITTEELHGSENANDSIVVGHPRDKEDDTLDSRAESTAPFEIV